MEALSSYTGDETNCLGSIEEEGEEDSEEEEENDQEQEEEDEQEDDTKEPRKGETKLCTRCRFQSLTSQAGTGVECGDHTPGRLINSDPLCSDESVVQGPQRSAWSAGVGFFQSTFKEVYSYVGEDIVIEEGLDSFAGMIWPGVSSTSFPTTLQTTQV